MRSCYAHSCSATTCPGRSVLWGRESGLPLLLSDRDLLEGFRRGDDQAIERVYHAHVAQVTALLRNGFSFMSGGQSIYFKGFKDAWDLEGAVQDVFIQAFSERARQSYDGIKPYGPFLLTIARNRVISLLRSEMREQRRRSMLAAEGPGPGPDTPERAAMQRQLEQLVARFIDGLDPALAEYYRVRYQGDHNLMQTARQLGLSRMKARIREQKLRQQFVEFLRRQGVLEQVGRGRGRGGLLMLLLLGGVVRP